MRTSVVLAIGCCVAAPAPAPAAADTSSLYYPSLEWLVDSSDSVVEATVVCEFVVGPNGNGRWETKVKSVDRVLKQVGKGVPPAGGDLTGVVLVKGENRVLLLTGVRFYGDRETYCVFLNEHPCPEPPAAAARDPLTLVPRYTAGKGRLAFASRFCVAINKSGTVLTDPAAVVKLVEGRVKAHPERVRATQGGGALLPREDDGDDHQLIGPDETPDKK